MKTSFAYSCIYICKLHLFRNMKNVYSYEWYRVSMALLIIISPDKNHDHQFTTTNSNFTFKNSWVTLKRYVASFNFRFMVYSFRFNFIWLYIASTISSECNKKNITFDWQIRLPWILKKRIHSDLSGQEKQDGWLV